MLQLLASMHPTTPLNSALLNTLLRPVLREMRDAYVARPSDAGLQVLAGRVARLLLAVVAMRREPVAKLLLVDLLKLV